MTKRKMIALILLAVVLLFVCTTVINCNNADNFVYNELQDYWNITLASNIYNELEECSDTNALHRSLFTSSPKYATFSKPAFAFAMLDRNGNVVFRSESGIWWQDYEGYKTNYISLEPFLRDDVRKEILEFQNENKDRYLIMRELKVHFSGDEFLPVSFTLDNQSKETRTFVLSDFEPTETIYEYEAHLYYEFYDLKKTGIEHKYFKKANEKLQEKIDNFVYKSNSGGGGGCGGGAMDFHHVTDDYVLYYFVEYNELYKALTSDEFSTMTVYSSFIFACAGLFIAVVAGRLFDKNKAMNAAKRAFTSAAAHELKTPLTVIQNRCECVMENIAPEKNGEYIKSIYDEALRMNGIVQSFLTYNRLSDETQVSKETVDLSSIVKTELEKYSVFAQNYGVNISSDIEEDILIFANAEMISMAVDNYLSNAVKYSCADKKVRVILTKTGKDFRFGIFNSSDDFVRIDSSVWDVLTRNDTARNSADNSSGMGLPICKHIFRLHGYKYWFEVKENETGFYFSGKKTDL